MGIGICKSGYGDWGGGFNYITDHSLKIIINKDFLIQGVSTHSFYNSDSSKKQEEKAKKIKKKLQHTNKFYIEDKMLKEHLEKIFEKLPIKRHIGYDVFKSPYMLSYIFD